MCSGRIDPSLIMEAFVNGADGVFCGGCLLGECRYISGNYQAQGKILLTQLALKRAGISPERLTIKFMSSAEAQKFVKYVSEFMDKIIELGRIGKAENLSENELKLKLEAVRNALEGKKLRWVVGKRTEFMESGNLYNEIFTAHEIERMFKEVVMDEVDLQEILLRLKNKPSSVKELSEKMRLPSHRILREIANLKKMGLVELEDVSGSSPLWKTVDE